MKRILKTGKCARPASALLLTGLILFLSLLGSSPQFHKLIHSDAGSPDHNCAITLFARGQIAAASAAPIVIGLVLLFGGIALLPESLLLPLADYRFAPSRAPPVAST
jgi:hypothetical protein